MIVFTIKAGVTSKPLNLTLNESDGSPSDLNEATDVVLRVWWADKEVEEFEMTIVDPDDGTITYEWAAGETDKIGIHRIEVEVTYDDATVSVWPNEGFYFIQFTSRIPRTPSAIIEWSDVIGATGELSDVSDLMQELIIAYVNDYFDPDKFGGDDGVKLRMARLYLAAHLGKLSGVSGGQAVSGPVTSESAGGLSRSYAVLTAGTTNLSTTSYGQLVDQLIRTSLARFPIVF